MKKACKTLIYGARFMNRRKRGTDFPTAGVIPDGSERALLAGRCF
jgi:hypothetical protein